MCGIILPMRAKIFLTPKQEKVLEFIKKRVGERLPPTIREVGEELGFKSTGTVRDYLRVLEQKGLLKRTKNRSRAIELIAQAGFNKIPVLGTIMAGNPNLAFEEVQGYIDTEDLLLSRSQQNDIFALRVKGDSMIEAGILEGDIAIIKKQPTAFHREIIAALLDNNEVTLKRLKRTRNNTFFLEAANKDYPPIEKKFSILGKLISVVRKY